LKMSGLGKDSESGSKAAGRLTEKG